MVSSVVGAVAGARSARRWAQFTAAMFGFGVAVALMVRSNLGLGPWDAFHVGLHRLTGVTVGTASGLVGGVVGAGAWWLGERPAIGTVTNMALISLFIDVALPYVPPASGPAMALGYYGVALPLAGLCTGMYISTGLGTGPRDGLTIALSRRSGLTVRRARTLVELVVLALGWAMGGVVGVGTVIFALLIGPSMQWGLRVFAALPAAGEVRAA
jgi:uncharacterized membrane protein YczE